MATGGSTATGDWHPSFLSDWIRAALLVRAWLEVDHLCARAGVDAQSVRRAIARAQRAKLAFEVLLPEVADDGGIALAPLQTLLAEEAARESPEAAANAWRLASATAGSDGLPAGPGMVPPSMPPMTDLSECVFDGLQLNSPFSGSTLFLQATAFRNTDLRGCDISGSDLSGALFDSCRFENVSLRHIDGPVRFVDCEFVSCRIEDGRASREAPWQFQGCHFDETTHLSQRAATARDQAGAAVSFVDCTCERPAGDWMAGDFLMLDPRRVDGLTHQASPPPGDPAADCLRRLLRPFFPSHATGGPAEHQARPYIRSSAVGRGVFPPGTPSHAALVALLRSLGFTDGGRSGHIYAPWSAVAGASDWELRNELSAFLRDGTRTPRIEQCITRLDREGSFERS
jgi:hypothetical protein